MPELISITETRRLYAQKGRVEMHYKTWKQAVEAGEFPAPVRIGKRFYYTPELCRYRVSIPL